MSVTYLSDPNPVSMADDWFGKATPDHFWMKRRFRVFERLATGMELPEPVADIGCGHGTMMRQFQDRYAKEIDGFDLNDFALKQAAEKQGLPVFCYDVFRRHPEFEHRYGLVFLFDVIEHIEDERSFVDAVLHHLRPGGLLAVNVPALPRLYSVYDEVAGHVRRYDRASLLALGERCGMCVERWTFWGLPLLPLAIIRKLVLPFARRQRVITRGFVPPGRIGNALCSALSGLEKSPQHLYGCSLMVLFRKPG